jgi:hypothetical protein
MVAYFLKGAQMPEGQGLDQGLELQEETQQQISNINTA